jgi:ankyrin repeat protein
VIVAGYLLSSATAIQSVYAFQKETRMTQEFFDTVTQGDVAKVKEMLKTDPALAHAKDQNGVSAIMKAAYYRKKEVVAALLATGLELNIFEAAATGQTERVTVLIKRDASLINKFSTDGFMPLGLAVFFGHLSTVEALLNAGAPVNVPSRESMKVTPLHSAAAARQVDIARLLIAHGANVNAAQADSGFTPLHEAALNGDVEFAKLLLEHGASINAKNKNGTTPLGYAAERRRAEMVKLLEARGAIE